MHSRKGKGSNRHRVQRTGPIYFRLSRLTVTLRGNKLSIIRTCEGVVWRGDLEHPRKIRGRKISRRGHGAATSNELARLCVRWQSYLHTSISVYVFFCACEARDSEGRERNRRGTEKPMTTITMNCSRRRRNNAQFSPAD